jgi:hypothetical protein
MKDTLIFKISYMSNVVHVIYIYIYIIYIFFLDINLHILLSTTIKLYIVTYFSLFFLSLSLCMYSGRVCVCFFAFCFGKGAIKSIMYIVAYTMHKVLLFYIEKKKEKKMSKKKLEYRYVVH